MDIYDVFLVILTGIASSVFTEGVSWLLIYRLESYQRLKANIDSLQKKIDKAKIQESMVSASKKSDKKIVRLEEQLKLQNQDMQMMKLKSMVVLAVCTIGILSFVNKSFSGRVVARLPFEPFGFITGLTHRGLEGTDYTECSAVFLYVLTNMAMRGNIQKYFGLAPPQSGFFTPPSVKTD
eukprot:GCRY01000497.1.p1 GENE.GCRY01000497.1~~GCRY01000497.1.p1  ORF type:complete len:180 (+),score=39.82 GCRY01000497.1:92-631(+)